VNDLLAAQSLLQAEADRLVDTLRLDDLLARIGRPVRVGSSALGLMVRRDIDITVICPDLGPANLAVFADTGAELMQRTDCVISVRFRNDSGKWNSEPARYPDGLYLGLAVRAADGADWTFDIWAVDQPERQPDLAHLKTLLPRLTEGHRETILTIKRSVLDWPAERKVPSAWIYEAVVDHGAADASQFEDWLRNAGKVGW
jgi:hypothetical protein